MKIAALVACPLLFASALATDPKPDLVAPKPADTRSIRVLLYVPGSPRLLDYPDVLKVVTCDAHSITFETHDGTVITHQGPSTVIQPRLLASEAARTRLSPGPQFYQAK